MSEPSEEASIMATNKLILTGAEIVVDRRLPLPQQINDARILLDARFPQQKDWGAWLLGHEIRGDQLVLRYEGRDRVYSDTEKRPPKAQKKSPA